MRRRPIRASGGDTSQLAQSENEFFTTPETAGFQARPDGYYPEVDIVMWAGLGGPKDSCSQTKWVGAFMNPCQFVLCGKPEDQPGINQRT